MTMSKALGGIGFPLAAIAYNKDLDIWEPGAHVGTFRGHVLAMTASLASLEYMDNTDLLSHCARLGTSTLKYLTDLANRSTTIGEIRGKGLIIGVELVKDKQTREPWKDLATKVQFECFKQGVILWKAGRFGNVIRFLPPLVITTALLDKALEIFSATLLREEKRFKSG